MPKKKTNPLTNLESQLFKAADKLRKNIDAAQYKDIVLGLVFLKYISDAFEERHTELKQRKANGENVDPEDKDYYTEKNVFWIPKPTRWQDLYVQARDPKIGQYLNNAMLAIEKENESLKNILPKVYTKQDLDTMIVGELMDLIGNIALGDEAARSKDILGRVYEYFLGEFALAEGRKAGQFYTPKSIVKLLVEMIEPYKGKVFDPCCGSGGMFVMSEKFIKEHQGKVENISIYGQESNLTTYRLCKMNLAIRKIESSQVAWNSEGSFLNDAHPHLRADFILANPPFNAKDWGHEHLQDDARWQYGIPPARNANFAWIQHFLHHLSPKGVAGFVLAKGSLTSQTAGEGAIRKALIKADLVDCIVDLPGKLFLNTGVPACLWFMSKKKKGINGDRKRTDEILFIDARKLGYLIDKTKRLFSDKDIQKIAHTYHQWRKKGGNYQDEIGFCSSAPIEKVVARNYVLNPGEYVGIPEEVDDFDFAERFSALQATFKSQLKEEVALNKQIQETLSKIDYEK